ncbi:MAG: hypothetical protein DHS20C21_19470 [Gemmatimonadota bacterium]|nr:MAG: hypothetical protein DHS20C21_19470 [Gemmatimonadota bacterium]
MGFLKGFRTVLLIVIMLIAIGFTVLNPGELVTVRLLFMPPLVEVNLVWVLFCAFLLGGLGGFLTAVLKIVELQAKLRDTKRSSQQLKGELTTLRNLPLDEPDRFGEESGS